MMMARIRDLRRDQGGAAVIEMAMAAPMLALLLIGMVDMSRGYSTKLQLEQVAQRTIEKVQNTDYSDTEAYKTAMKAEAAAAAGVATSAVTIQSWLECNNNGTKLSFTSSCADPNQPYARYVEVTIQKIYTPMFSTKFAGANADGTYTLSETAGVRVQ